MSQGFTAFFSESLAAPGRTQPGLPKEVSPRLMEVLQEFDALFLEALGVVSAEDTLMRASHSLELPQSLWNLDRARILADGFNSLKSESKTPDVPEPEAASPQAAPVSGTPETTTKNPFLDSLWTVAKDTAESLGVPVHLLLAHAALESGWGKRSIQDANGGESHNLFGIKAGRGWKGKTVEVRTTEYVSGIPQARVETFRAYDSYREAFADYARLLKTRFTTALGQTSGEGFGQALQEGGYATDPRYAGKIAAVARSVSAQLQVAA